uniref:Phosphoglycerate kinase, glycosomal n=2 Tax=Trypanosoma congolense TaxID=5692 RepID=PGKG_TRYCO|nr:RecName: Full=Phosphoglycerate kinase, glycosomal [Trypanosoma congolense]AAC37221.1 phosphoglycerate kinase [Trypanosoma congolense]CCC89266.1 putative phosphoglycerate kinase [Trypanosoma congolense IL3000]
MSHVTGVTSNIRIKKTIDDIWPLTAKRVLVRVDFNVPIQNGHITNDYRIRATIPTIQRIIDQGGICILLSHLGRPAGISMTTAVRDVRRRYHEAHFHDNKGKTAFFSVLPPEEKIKILAQSSLREEATHIMPGVKSGKTILFARLPEDEKKQLLMQYLDEKKDNGLPQLSVSAGYEEQYSLRPVAVRLAELLGQHVYFAHDCMDAKMELSRLKRGNVMLLENVRFYREEDSKKEEEREAMAKVLASYGDIFVSDAFGTAHRDSATMTGIPKVLGHGAAGYLMEKEISYFSKVLGNPPRPLVAIVGGSKVSDKIQLLDNMLQRIDYLLIGGAMAYTFLKAQGHRIGTSMCEEDRLDLARSLLKKAEDRKVQVLLPVDHVCHTEFKAVDTPVVTADADIPDGHMALDIGPKTIANYVETIGKCKSAIWNGPMGVFEMTPYSKGTFAVAKAMGDCTQKNGLMSIIGGGDSASAAEQSGEATRMSHVSTGGGASLELLEGKTLPGVAILDDKE